MGKAIPAQHPAVVLRSHYRQVRALLAIAMIAVVGLTTAVVILATDDDRVAGTGSPTQVTAPTPSGRDAGTAEGSRGIVPAQPPSTRFDGGPEEGTRGAAASGAASNAMPEVPLYRYDGGPGPIDSDGSGR